MTMPVHSLMLPAGPAVFYTPEFRVMIESHLKYLREHPETQILNLNPHSVYKYEHDLFGLLGELNIPPQHHWIVMRVNGYTNPVDLVEGTETLLIPSLSAITSLLSVHNTSNQLTT
jgi:hypothetical protein